MIDREEEGGCWLTAEGDQDDHAQEDVQVTEGRIWERVRPDGWREYYYAETGRFLGADPPNAQGVVPDEPAVGLEPHAAADRLIQPGGSRTRRPGFRALAWALIAAMCSGGRAGAADPISVLATLLATFFSLKTYEARFEPLIADYQDEYYAARDKRQTWRAAFRLLALYAHCLLAAWAHVKDVIKNPLPKPKKRKNE